MAQPRADLAAQLVRASLALDDLIADVQLGRPTQAAIERQLDECRRLGTELLAVAGKAARPASAHPPLFVSDDRTLCGW